MLFQPGHQVVGLENLLKVFLGQESVCLDGAPRHPIQPQRGQLGEPGEAVWEAGDAVPTQLQDGEVLQVADVFRQPHQLHVLGNQSAEASQLGHAWRHLGERVPADVQTVHPLTLTETLGQSSESVLLEGETLHEATVADFVRQLDNVVLGHVQIQ